MMEEYKGANMAKRCVNVREAIFIFGAIWKQIDF
jgi:hypothetical protein